MKLIFVTIWLGLRSLKWLMHYAKKIID